MNKVTKYSVIFLPVIALVTSALLFLPNQSLWVDETTQLSGLTLGPVKVLGWLAGGINPFDVPADRMPPMSYWAEMAWAALFGLNEYSIRHFAVVISALTVLVFHLTSRRVLGVVPGVICSLCFALSPNIVVQAVNIRTYPLFLLFSVCAFYSFIRLLEQPKSYDVRWLICLAASCILASYSHFFGLLLTGSAFLSLFAIVYHKQGKVRPILIAGAMVAVFAMGLVPFVEASFQHSSGSARSNFIHDIVKLGYRQFSHAAIAVNSVILSITLLAAIILVAITALRFSKMSSPVAGIAMVLVSATVVILAGSLHFSRFSATHPSYNIWMTPAVLLLAFSALKSQKKWIKVGATAAGIAFLAGNLYGSAQLAIHGKYFAPVRFPEIAKLIDHLGPEKIAILYDEKDDGWGHVYFPVQYTYGDRVQQYLYIDEKKQWVKLPARDPVKDVSLDKAKYIIQIQTKSQDYKQIAAEFRKHQRPLEIKDIPVSYTISRKWHLFQKEHYPAFCEVEANIFEKADHPKNLNL